MRSFKVHACAAETNGRIPFMMVSLCGRQRVGIDMSGLQPHASKTNDSIALSLDALYDLLQGKSFEIDRADGAISLSPQRRFLLIQKAGSPVSHKVWMAELALAWNMLVGYEGASVDVPWKMQ